MNDDLFHILLRLHFREDIWQVKLENNIVFAFYTKEVSGEISEDNNFKVSELLE